MDQSRAPVVDAIKAFRERDHLTFLPPGHKQGRGVDKRVLDALGADVFGSDIIVLGGLDDRLMTGEVLSDAEKLMAEAVDATNASFSTCGSSLSVKSAMLAVAGPGQKLLVSRNAHKSVVAGLILSGVDPVWVHPRWDAEQQFAYPPEPDAVAEAYDRSPDVQGMLLITPTDYGTCADIKTTARLCHDRGIPLIVDEAWGAHLPFHPDLPAWAMDSGADLCVTSVHKMGAGLEQGSVYHQQGDLVSMDVLSACADLLDTTSPSALIYAGLDGWRRQMVEHGHELLDKAMTLAQHVRQEINMIPGLHALTRDDLVGPDRAHDADPLKVVIDFTGLGRAGYDVNKWLREHHHLDVGMSDHRRVGAQITIADDEQTAARLLDALRDVADRADDIPEPKPIAVPAPGELELEQVMLPRDAFFGSVEQVPAADAIGRVSAETISPYPPGVPAVLPGEVITKPVVDYLRTGVAAGMLIPDAFDKSIDTMRVVARSGQPS